MSNFQICEVSVDTVDDYESTGTNASYIKGKALLVITRLDSELVPFDVYPFIQSCNGNSVAGEIITEYFNLLDTGTLSLPDAAYKLNVGETVRVSVVFQFDFHVDYYG